MQKKSILREVARDRCIANFTEKERRMCTYCKQAGHSMDKYYKLHGYSSGFKVKQIFTGPLYNQSRQVAANQVVSDSNSEQDKMWQEILCSL